MGDRTLFLAFADDDTNQYNCGYAAAIQPDDFNFLMDDRSMLLSNPWPYETKDFSNPTTTASFSHINTSPPRSSSSMNLSMKPTFACPFPAD